MEKIRINGKMENVFVLKDSEEAMVYIPLSALQKVDYDRLVKMEEAGGEMLATLRKTKLDNGRNALAMYDDIIQVIRKYPTKNVRVPKPDHDSMSTHEKYQAEVERLEEKEAERKLKEEKEAAKAAPAEEKAEQPKKRGPGRPRKNQTAS